MQQEIRLSLEELRKLPYYTPSRAVEYLRRIRGIDFAVSTLRSIRRYNRANSKAQLINNTLWSKEELDAIEITPRTKRVEPEEETQQEVGRNSPLML